MTYLIFAYFFVKAKKTSLLSITVTTLFVVLIFLPQPFFISKDAYRYIWDGMLIIKGENPYLYVPEDEKLKKYWEQDKLLARNKDPKATKTYQLYQNLDWKGLHTPYPPFAQFIFGLSYLAYMQFGIIGVRIILCLPIFVLAYLLYKNQSQKLACLLLLNPLVVSEIYYSAHIDSYVLLFIYLAITTFEKQKEIKASFWTALGFITKLYPAFLVPFFTAKLIKEKKFRLLAICASCFMLISVIAWAPFINHGFEPIKRYLTLPDEQEYNASIYRWTYQILEKQNILNANNCGAKQNCQSLTEEKQVAKYASLAILIIGTIYLMSKDFSINVLLSAGILYLFVSPLVFPWHTLFLIPLVFISVMKNKNYKLLIPLFLYQVIVAWAYFEPQSKSTRDLMLNIEYALAIVLIILYAFILKNQYKFDYRK